MPPLAIAANAFVSSRLLTPFVRPPECCRESLILAYEGSDSQPFGIFDTELRRYRVRHAAQGDDVHGIGNAVANRVIALVIAAPPVRNSFSPEEYGPVIVNS